MNTGCPDCDRTSLVSFDLCPKHRVEYLKWVADAAQKDYEKAMHEYEAELSRQAERNK